VVLVYFVVKVTAGQERVAANMLQNKLAKANVPIYSIMIVEGMRGYLIVEAEDEVAVRTFITKERNIRGVLPKPLNDDEVNKLVETENLSQMVENGDTIEFVTGPFKGYKAKVIRVDEVKDDITVELMDVPVPIPITTKGSTAKVVQKASKNTA
jgi:transcriptional antiterminator NusG